MDMQSASFRHKFTNLRCKNRRKKQSPENAQFCTFLFSQQENRGCSSTDKKQTTFFWAYMYEEQKATLVVLIFQTMKILKTCMGPGHQVQQNPRWESSLVYRPPFTETVPFVFPYITEPLRPTLNFYHQFCFTFRVVLKDMSDCNTGFQAVNHPASQTVTINTFLWTTTKERKRPTLSL